MIRNLHIFVNGDDTEVLMAKLKYIGTEELAPFGEVLECIVAYSDGSKGPVIISWTDANGTHHEKAYAEGKRAMLGDWLPVEE